MPVKQEEQDGDLYKTPKLLETITYKLNNCSQIKTTQNDIHEGVLSFSTVVLNSRDRQGNLWLP